MYIFAKIRDDFDATKFAYDLLEDGIASEISNYDQDWNPELTVNQLLFVLISAIVLVYSIYSYSDNEKN